MPSIEATVTNQQITATAGETQIDVAVGGGVGPTGSQGPSGVVTVSAPLTNDGTTTSAQLGLSVGSGLQVSGGSIVLASHQHDIANVTGLQSALDGKAASSHTHSLSGLTGSGATTNQLVAWSGTAWTPTSTITLPGLDTDSSLKIGPLEVQGNTNAINGGWVAHNLYLNGTQIVRRSTGPAGMLNFIGTEGQFRFYTSGAAGSTVSSSPVFKVGAGGVFAVGAAVSASANSVTGAFVFHNGTRFGIADATTTTKRVDFDVSSVSANTTRTLAIPDSNGTIALVGHTHAVSDLTQSGATTNQVIAWNGTAWAPATVSSGYTLPTATDSVLGGVKIGSGVTITDGVISVSTNYAAASHSHAIGDVTGLQAALDGKQAAGSYAAASHTHALSSLTQSGATTNQVIAWNGTAWAPANAATGSGTVTSVGLSLPNIFTVTNSPVTGSGTLTGALATQSANVVFAGPTTGAAAAPTFRSLVSADLPSHTHSPSAITFAATDRLLGRSTAGGGAGEEIVCTSAGRSLIAGASASAQRTTLGLAIGTNVQGWSDWLEQIVALTTDADNSVYGDYFDFVYWWDWSTGLVKATQITSFARSLLDDGSSSAARTTLGLGTASTRDAPASGNATSSQVVLGNDTRLADGNRGDITVGSSGASWTINAGAVVTADIADSAVTTAKIADSAVTLAKTTGIQKSITVSSSSPTGGSDGDIWLKY